MVHGKNKHGWESPTKPARQKARQARLPFLGGGFSFSDLREL